MSNLGTLSFDVDLDLSKLQAKINQQNEAVKQALEGLQVKVATKSVGELAQQIQSELNNHQFAIKLDEAKLSGLKSDIVAIAEKSKEITDNFARMGQGGGGTQQAVNIDFSKFNGISEIIEKIEGEMKRLYNVFADTTDGSGKQVAGLITNLTLLKDALEQLGTAAKNFTPTQHLNEAATAAQNVATATQNAAKATKTASDEEAEAIKKANIERERQLKLIAEVQTMLSKIGGISSENTGLNPQRINEVKQAYEGMLKSLSTIPPSKSLQELSAELATLKANTKGFFQEVSQSQKAVDSIRLVRYALKQVNEQMASGNTSPKLEGFREQLQAINREMHNLMKAGNLDGIQNLFAGHKGMSDGVVSIIRQMVTEMKKLGVATQETAGITSHLSAEEQKLAQSIQQSTNSMRGQSQILSDLKTIAMQYLSVWGAQSFIHNIIQTGGLLEQQRMSIGAILGDLSQANHLFGQIQQLALKSPFGVVQLDTMSKQLTAYNFKYSELYDWTKRLADISAATGTEVSRLSLALGHVRSEGALSGYTLRQFAMGNVPLLQTLAQQLGKTTSEIRKMTREKAITYDDVEKALRTLTDEGGIFFNAQEVMSNALNAKFKNMYDAFDIMFGKMAESGVGDILKKVAETMTVLAKNWQQTGAVILSVAGYLGLHKAAMLASNKAMIQSNLQAGRFTAAQLEMQAATGNLNKQMLLQAVAAKKMSVADAEAAAATLGLSRAQLQHVANTGKVAAAYNMATIATSKYTVQQLRLLATFRAGSWTSWATWLNGLKVGWMGVSAAAKVAGTAIKGFFAAAWPMLAISAAVEAITYFVQKAGDAKDRVKDLLQTANEGFKSLEKSAQQFKIGASVTMDDKLLEESIKEMDEILKSYLPKDAHGTLNEAFRIDPETGKSVHSLKEQYEMLAEQLDVTRDAYKELGKINDSIEVSNDETDGWFDESFRQNTEDYIKALKKRNQAETDFVANNRILVAESLEKTRQAFKDYDKYIKSQNALYEKTEGKSGFAADDLKSQLDILKSGYKETQYFMELIQNANEKSGESWMKYESAVRNVGIAHKEMTDDLEVFSANLSKRLKAIYGEDVSKWTEAQKLAVQKSVELFMTGIDGYSDMAENERIEIEKKLLAPYNIPINVDAREANKALTEMQAYLEGLVNHDWVVRLKLQTVGSFEEYYDQLDKNVKKGMETMKKLGSHFSDAERKSLENEMVDVNTLTGQTKEYAQAWQLVNDSKKAAVKEGWKLSSLEKQANKDASAARKAETAAKKEQAAAEKAAKDRQKMADAQMKIEEDLAKQRRELEDSIADLELAQIKNDAERERKQRDIEFEKQKRQIEDKEKEWKKTAYELAKKEHESNPENKTIAFADTEIGKAGWQGIQLTKEQYQTLENMRKTLIENEKRDEQKRTEDLVKQYQSYTDQRLEIEKRYKEDVAKINAAIADAQKRGDTEAVEQLTRSLGEAAKKQMKELSEAAMKNLQDSPLFSLAWKDLSRVSSETLTMLIDKFKEVEGQFSGDPEAMREWTERIKAMSDELVSRNPFAAMAQARKEYIEALKEQDIAKVEMEELKKREGTLEEEKAYMEERVKLLEAWIITQKLQGFDMSQEEEQLNQAKTILSSVSTQLLNIKNKLKKAEDDYAQAVQKASSAEEMRKAAEQKTIAMVGTLSSAIKGLGDTIGGTAGEILNLIGDVMDFATTVYEGVQQIADVTLQVNEAVKTSSKTTAEAMGAIEKASIILTIISAALKIAQKIADLIPDAFDQYEKYRDKVNEVNKMEQAVRDYEMAVLEARNAEDSWFASSGMRDLSKQWLVSSKASENYFKKLNELQATYQNESGNGWLTKLGAQANKTIASIGDSINKAIGIENTAIGNAMTEMAQFGWANVAGGPVGAGMWAENKIWNKGFDKDYVDGLTQAWRNLRIETRAASKGFLGTGVGGHSQRTEDLVSWVKRELGFDLFDEDGWLKDEAYESIMKNYEDKLVGETKETLESLKELKEKHDEFLEQLHQFVNEMYSPIIQNFNDAMWEWYDEGTDALEAFRKAAGDTFRKIVSDLLDTQMLKLFGNEMSETITQLYTDYFDKGTISYGELMSGVTQAVDTASAKFVEAQPVLKATMLSVEESLSKMGIEMKSMGDTASGMFSDLSQAYRSMLLNMESDTKDFGDEVIRILTESLIDKFVLGDEFEKKIEEITKKATSIVEATHVVVDADGNRTFISSIEEGVIKAQNSIAEYENQIKELSKRLANEQSSIMQEHVKELEKLRKKQEELDRQWLDNKLTQSQYNEAAEALAEEIAALEIAYEQQAQENEKILAITAEIDSREQRIRELKQDIYNIEHSETITEEERKAALLGVQDELQREYELRQGLVKTMKDMMGLTMIERISATSLSNVGEELLSMLQDTSKGVDDWKDDIVKKMTDDLIKEVVYNEEFRAKMREFQKEYVTILSGDTDTKDKEEALAALAKEMAEYATATKKTAEQISSAMGQIGGSTTESPFSNLRDTFLNTLADMEGDAEKFRETLNKTLMQDLIEKMVLDVPMTVSIEGVEKAFDNFDAYSKDWNDRYVKGTQEVAAAQKALREAQISGDKQVIESAEKRYNAAKAYIDSIIDEMVEVQAISLEAAEEFKKRMKEVQKDTTFTDMKSNFVNALMDMEGSVEDFANDIKKTIVQHLVESFMVSKYIQPLLDDLQYSLDFVMKQYGTEGWELGTPEGMAAWLQNDWTEYLEDGTEVVHKGINSVAAEINPVKDLVKALMKSIGYEVKEGGENASGEAASAFDNLGDTILSSLMNTESGVEDFMKSLNETIVNELVESYMATDQFKQELNDVKVGLKDTVDNVVRWEQAVKNAKTDEEFAYANEQLKVANQLLADAKQSAEALYNSAAEGTEKYTDALKNVEVLQDTTFKDLGDSLLSALMDTTKSATDWAQDIGKVMAQKIFEGMMKARNAQGILDNIQTVFNDAVTAATDENGKTDWTKVLNTPGLMETVSNSTEEFNSLREAWKRVCEALGLDYEEALNDLPLSDLGSNLIDSLLDTEQTAKDFGKKMAVNLMTEMLTELFNDRYTTKLNEIREHWQKALSGEDGYTLDSVRQEITDLRTELDNLAEDDPIRTLSGDIKELGKAIEELPIADIGDTILDSLLDAEEDAAGFGKRMAVNLMKDMLAEMTDRKYAEQIKKIRELWLEATDNSGRASMEDVLSAIDQLYATMGDDKKMKVFIDKINDFTKATEDAKTAFDNLTDTIVDGLTDADMTAEKFAKNIAKTLTSQMLQSVVDTQFADTIKTIKEDWAAALEKGDTTAIERIKQKIVELYGAADKATESLQEIFKELEEAADDTTPFDNLRSSFLSQLMDMESDAEDFAADINKILTESFIDEFVLGAQFDQELEKWKNEYKRIKGEDLSEEERARQLRQLQDSISSAQEEYAKAAREIQDLMAYGEYQDQTATVNMADKATYDQFDMYLGIAVAQQITSEHQLGVQQQILATLQSMGGLGNPGSDAMLAQVSMANSQLQLIRDYSKKMCDQMEAHMGSIDSKLNALNTRL